jgi:hypothetical protein
MPILIGALVIGIMFRYLLLLSPTYRYVYYDEAIPGIMALDILQGELPLVYWGHPYLGSLDAFSAAALFFLFGSSTLMLRISVLCYFAVFAVFLFKLGQQITGKAMPWYLLIFLVIPPLGLNQFSLSTIGGYMHVVAMGTIMMYLTARLLEEVTAKQEITLFALLGFVAGLGFWTFIMIVPYIAGCYGTLFLKYRFRLFRFPLLFSVLMFGLGSLPSWIWNFQHEFIGLTAKSKTVALADIPKHLDNLYNLFVNILGRTDEYVLLPFFHSLLTWAITILLAAVILYWFRHAAFDLLKAVVSKQRTPSVLDMVVICFFVSAASFVLSDRGQYSLIRYGMIFYSTLPLLIVWFFYRLSRERNWLHVIFLPLLLLMLVPYNFAFIRNGYMASGADDMAKLIDFMKEQNLHHAYAHYTVGHSITFESGKDIIISDFGGYRNIDYLRKVDRSERVAIITDRTIAIPSADAMERQLQLITNGFKLKHFGKYTVFYDFVMAGSRDIDISSKIKKVSTCKNQATAGRMTDRNISTYWTTHEAQQIGDEIIIELSEPLPVSQISLQPGARISDFPKSLNVDVSLDGKQWKPVKQNGDMVESFLSMGNKPRLFGNGQLDISLAADRVRFLRLRLAKDDGLSWSIAELFVFSPQKTERGLQLTADQLSTFLQEYPVDMIYMSPWLIAQLDPDKQLQPNLFPLYPDGLLYQEVYRKWDFSSRYVDFSRVNLFVLLPQWVGSTVEHLRQMGIEFKLDRRGALSFIRTEKQEFLQQAIQPFDTIQIERRQNLEIPGAVDNWQVYQMRAPATSVDGFILTLPGKTEPSPEVKVFLSEDGIFWKQQDVSTHTSSYWSDYSLLEANTSPVRRFYFSETISEAYVRVALRPSETTVFSLGASEYLKPVFFNL